uniref:HTH_Tnp_Tc3_2 domain-containing protein n=1 Tax=Caenorhabditis japonica TaxID=281687 RepID=A0A8R1HNF0_CAEJA
MDRNILRACRKDPRRTSTDIQVSVTSPNESVPLRRTIIRRLQVAGLHGRRPVKKPLHLSWGPREWANHIWSDESKFNLFGTDGIQWIRRPIGSRYAPQYQCLTVKHGGSCRQLVSTSPCGSPGMAKSVPGLQSHRTYVGGARTTSQRSPASNANQKLAQLKAAWKSIPMTVVQTLLDSMPRRCQAVIDAKAYPTKY